MLTRIKLLPVTIFAALLLLTVKIGDIWHDAGALLGSAAAQGAEGAAARNERARGSPEPVVFDTDGSRIDVTDVSPAEIEILENLAARREVLEGRARELDMRENLLDAVEKRAEAKIGELKKMYAAVERLIHEFDEREKARIEGLVKIYERMKSKDAARIFNQLEPDILLDVVSRMREANAAAILAKMDAEKAKAVTADLARPRALPTPGDIEK